MGDNQQGAIRSASQSGAAIARIFAEIETPSNQIGPLHAAYERATQGIGHALLGACAAVLLGGYGLAFGLAVATAYWLIKERGDLRRGGAWADGIEDALLVCIGTYYGPWWWPLVLLAVAGYLMLMGAIRE